MGKNNIRDRYSSSAKSGTYYKNRRKRQRRRNKGNNRCCLNCFITLVVTFVVFVGALYGGAFFAWNQFVEPQVGISLNDALSLAVGLYTYKEDEIVTNPYKESDLTAFYTNLSNALYLDESVDLKKNIFEVLDSFLATSEDENQSTEDQGVVSTRNSIVAAEEGTEGESNTSNSITGNEALDNFLKELKFDFSRLKEYDETYATDSVLSLTDKQLAAFINDTIKTAVQSEGVSSKIPEMVTDMGIDLANVVVIPQIAITNKTPTDLTKVKLTLTVQINIRDVAQSVIKKYYEPVAFLSKILPKSFYATVSIYPNDYMAKSEILVDSYSDKQMNTVYTLANYFLKDSEYGSIEGILQMVNQKVVDIIEQVQEIVPVDFIYSSDSKKGSVDASPIKALMGMLHVDNLTEAQFFCMIRDIGLQNFDDIKTDLGFSETTKRDDIEGYIEDGQMTMVSNISSQYAIENGYLTKDNLFDKITNITGGSAGSDTIINHINLSNLDFGADTYVAREYKVAVPYLAMAGLMANYVSSATGSVGEGEGSSEESAASGLSYSILNLYYDGSKDTLSIVVEVGVLAMLSGNMDENSLILTLASQLIPEYIYITANINVETKETTIQINGKSVERTAEYLNTISSLLSGMGTSSEGLDTESMIANIGTAFLNGLDGLAEQLGTSIVFEDNSVLLPSVYEIMAGTILKAKEEGQEDLTSEQVYDAFKGICVIPRDYEGTNKAQDLSEFIDQVNNKYSISSANRLSLTSEDTIVTQFQSIGANYNSAIDGVALASAWTSSVSALTYSTDAELLAQKQLLNKESFNPFATEAEAAKLFSDAFSISGDGVSNIELQKVFVISSTEIRLIYTCNYLSTEGENDYSKLIPNFVINVVLDMSKIDSIDEKCIHVTINDMSDASLANFSTVCSRFSPTAFDILEIEATADTTIKGSLGALFDKLTLTFEPEEGEREARIYFGSIYDAAYKNVIQEGDGYVSTDIADTIAALHTGVDVTAQNNITSSDEYDVTEIDFDLANVLSGELGMKADLTGRNLGYAIKESLASTPSFIANLGMDSSTEINSYQTAVVDLSGTSDEIAALKASLSNLKMATDPVSGDITTLSQVNSGMYLVTTIQIQSSGMGYTSTLLPENIYVTIIIDLSNGNVAIGYNNLSRTETGVINRLAGGAQALDLDETATNMHDYIMDVVILSVTYQYNPMMDPLHINIRFGDVVGQSGCSIENTSENNKVSGVYKIDKKITF